MLPVSIQILHELENHEHTICTSVSEHHIHKQELDCEFHFFKTHQTYIANSTYTSIISIQETAIIDGSYNFLLEYQPLSYRSRGPPALN